MQYKELTANGTFTIKTGAGFLHGIMVNVGTGTTPTLQIFDNITNSAPAIAGGSAGFAIPASTPVLLSYDAHFSTGLTIVVGGTFSGSLTVEYF